MPSLLRRPVSAGGIWQLARSEDRQDQPIEVSTLSGESRNVSERPRSPSCPHCWDLRLAADQARTDCRVTVTWPQTSVGKVPGCADVARLAY